MPWIVWGPPGSGKTKNKERIRQHFGAVMVVDEWQPNWPLPSGSVLILSQRYIDGAMYIDDVLAEIDKRKSQQEGIE